MPRRADETPDADARPEIRVEDKRHWARGASAEDEPATPPSTVPSVVDEYRARAEAAEAKLQEYIAAFKQWQAEQEQTRLRLNRDTDRRADLRFAGLAGELLVLLDDLQLALGHARAVPQAAPLAQGIDLAVSRFLSALERSGIERIAPDGTPFDPTRDEALRVDPVDDPERDGTVTETLRPGFRLGETLVRPARVAVGKVPRD